MKQVNPVCITVPLSKSILGLPILAVIMEEVARPNTTTQSHTNNRITVRAQVNLMLVAVVEWTVARMLIISRGPQECC
jgi:hypothetical protein